MFVDHITIQAKAGDGGDGTVSFRREKFIPRGGPDGGDGGKGGSIILRVDSHTDDLRKFFYDPNLRAESGKKGGNRLKSGRSGVDRVFRIPQGTLVFREAPASDSHANPGESALSDSDKFLSGTNLIADLTDIGQDFVLCRGGRGGKGNDHFKSATHRVPTEFTPGEKGEEGRFRLELRQIADAGFVGFPNAGKSSLLSLLSAARPKIAPYPFTTLHPMIGVIEYPEFRTVRVADIPGLIEGAHRNVGLGHEFLRHLLRCRLLLFVVDTAGSEGRDPVEDIRVLRSELSLYDKVLSKRLWLILANKMDLPSSPENVERIKSQFKRVKVIPVSAHSGDGLEALKSELHRRVHGSSGA